MKSIRTDRLRPGDLVAGTAASGPYKDGPTATGRPRPGTRA